jgi:hypothetical protein
MDSHRHKNLNFAEVLICDYLVFVYELKVYLGFPTARLEFPGNMESLGTINSGIVGGGGDEGLVTRTARFKVRQNWWKK